MTNKLCTTSKKINDFGEQRMIVQGRRKIRKMHCKFINELQPTKFYNFIFS